MRDFRKMMIWERSMKYVVLTYTFTKQFPDDERFGLISQMRRASVSISSNIAEGSARNSDTEFKRFLEISLGSAFELETQLIISNEMNYLKNEKFNECLSELQEIQKMINSFINKLKK